MFHADNPLHYHIIESFHEADPDHAFRFRPFVYGSRRHHLAAPAGPQARRSFRPGERVGELFNLVSCTLIPRRKACAPCCSTPSC